MPLKTIVTLGALALSLLTTHSAAAEPTATAAPDRRASFHADVEVDPTAYALDGYSVHVGLGYRRFRFDLGAFALDVPQFVHGNRGFDASANGFGIKLQYFLFAEQERLFVGVDAVLSKLVVAREHTQLAKRHRQFSTSVQVGYRFMLPAGFYIMPWIGVGYEFLAEDVTLDGVTYEASPLVVFPAIHLGYRFL